MVLGEKKRLRDGTLMTVINNNLVGFFVFFVVFFIIKCKVRIRLPTSGSLGVELDEIVNINFKSV